MRLLALSLLVSLPLCLSSSAQDKGDKGKGGGQPSNLKVLKVASGREIGPIMRTFTTGLGVQCTFCHVQGNFPSDDNPKKDIARMMITMVEHINAGFPDGKVHVTCYTCHRGEQEPKTEAPKAQ
jgi:photosynthetic reaction center cytochrome c subunit